MTRSILFSDGIANLHDDGTVESFTQINAKSRNYLLDENSEKWHTSEYRWGSGFAITDQGSGRWCHPLARRIIPNGVVLSYKPIEGILGLDVTREGGDVFTEVYRWKNISAEELVVTSLAISAPIRDIYPSAKQSLEGACHAHVWTGGKWSWLLAQPMSGEGPVLGTVTRGGALWGYSVESRNSALFSNIRGHIMLHPTDHARNPNAFGGQPKLSIAPGETYELKLESRFYSDSAAFLADTDPPVQFDRFAAPLGEQIVMRNGADAINLSGTRHGISMVDINEESRTAVLFHDTPRNLVESRVKYILDRQRPTERPEPDCYAFVPCDTQTGLTQTGAGWADWSDGAERLSMPSLLQQARFRGWGDAEKIDSALCGWAEFARKRLIDDSATVRWGSDTTVEKPRLYNFPWMAHFFADQYRLFGDLNDLELAARLLERSYELGATEHLSIGHSHAVLSVVELLLNDDQAGRAAVLLKGLRDQADHFQNIGMDLPGHEVNYEQSMVAPLVSALAIASQIWPERGYQTAIATALKWLKAFSGPQPHVRLHNIAIRHWDGYFFGRNRQWGDTFPHYWSVLTAVALNDLPADFACEETKQIAQSIFRANLVDFDSDGTASAAFVFPTAIDGVPAHHVDSLANDQDWVLTLWLRSEADLN